MAKLVGPMEKLALKFDLKDLAGVDIKELTPCAKDISRMKDLRHRRIGNADIDYNKPCPSTDSWEIVNFDSVKRAFANDCEAQAKKITDICKCIRRAFAAEEVLCPEAAKAYYDRAKELMATGKFKVGHLKDPRA